MRILLQRLCSSGVERSDEEKSCKSINNVKRLLLNISNFDLIPALNERHISSEYIVDGNCFGPCRICEVSQSEDLSRTGAWDEPGIDFCWKSNPQFWERAAVPEVESEEEFVEGE